MITIPELVAEALVGGGGLLSHRAKCEAVFGRASLFVVMRNFYPLRESSRWNVLQCDALYHHMSTSAARDFMAGNDILAGSALQRTTALSGTTPFAFWRALPRHRYVFAGIVHGR